MATKSGLQKRFDNFKNSEGSKNPFSRKNRHKKHPEDRPQDLAQEEQPPNLKPIPPLPELAPGDFGAATPPRSDPSVVLSRKELPPPNVNNQRVNTFPTERSNGQTDRQPALLQPIVDVQRGTADISSYLLTDQDLDEQVPPPCPKTDSHTYEIGREITPGNPDDYHFNIRDPTRRRTLESPSELQESPRPGLQERLWECERQLKEAREQIQAAEAKGSQLESLKVEIARQNQKLTHLEAMRESKKDIKRRYRQELDDSERLRRWELEVQRRGHQQRWQTYSKELESKHIERIRALEREHIGKEENAEKQITALRTQIEREKDEKRIEVQELMDEKQRLTAIYQQDLTNLQNEATRIEGEHAKNHEAWVTWHHDELAKNKGEYKAKLDLLKAGLAGKLKESKDKYDQEVEEHDREMKEYEAKMENMKDDHARKVQELDKTHSDRIKSLEQKLVARHKNQIRSLNEDVRELNATLLRRDDEVYTGMVFTTPDLPHSPDEEIRHQFGQIQQLVDELGRTEWKQDRTVWKDELIQGLDQKGGQRLLRKAILQDIIWTILFQAVFCSPFRMFGEEGIKLDQEWNEGCGREDSSEDMVYRWPPPGFKAERWRYITMKECLEVLQKPKPSQLDPRARVEDGFKRSLRSLVSSLKSSLEEVVELETAQTSKLQGLATQASRVWINLCMHRCRIRIRLNGQETMTVAEKAKLAGKDPLELTEMPEVGRHGNVKGIELDSFTVIAGLEGKGFDISST